MFRVFNDYLSRISIRTDSDISSFLEACLTDMKDIKKFSVSINTNRYLADIRLSGFSVEMAEACFKELSDRMAYPYSAFYVRYNEGKVVRYKFATCREDKTGFYLELMFS